MVSWIVVGSCLAAAAAAGTSVVVLALLWCWMLGLVVEPSDVFALATLMAFVGAIIGGVLACLEVDL